MAELKRDQLDSKCFLLRIKHQDKDTGRTDFSVGSEYQKELAEWLEEKKHSPGYDAIAHRVTESYIKRMQPSVKPNSLPIYEPQALIALSATEAIYKAEAEATAADLRDHLMVRDEVKIRHDEAHAKWVRFIRSKLAKFESVTEQWADVEKREAEGDKGQSQAAD